MANHKPICAVAKCGKVSTIRGWCNAHYLRFIRHGSPDGGGPRKTENGTLPAYFQQVVLSHSGDACLLWPYGRTGGGYAAMRVSGRPIAVHRLVCEHVNGPAPTEGHEAAHSCGRGSDGCVSPRHLRWATGADNQADRLIHGTDCFGEAHPRAKLTEADVRAIRQDFGRLNLTELADRHGVTKQNISFVVRRRTWPHVP